jgi:6-phosphogluconate dehydrogenase
MELGMVGLGRMGLNMTIRLSRAKHRVVANDRSAEAVSEAAAHGATPAPRLPDLVSSMATPRAVWLMVPSGVVDAVLDQLVELLGRGDLVIDGGNSNWRDSQRRAERLRGRGLEYVDCGTSGGIWGLELGYCMMLGGEPGSIARIAPVLDALAPKNGWKHVGPSGAGHFSKMVHNGIEYGMMQAYAEGFELLQASPFGYDLAALAKLWNQGSVVRSWLLELAGDAFERDPGLQHVRAWVEDSGEGRWTVQEAIDLGVPAEVLAISLFARFRSRQPESFRDRVIASLRQEFGGHAIKER